VTTTSDGLMGTTKKTRRAGREGIGREGARHKERRTSAILKGTIRGKSVPLALEVGEGREGARAGRFPFFFFLALLLCWQVGLTLARRTVRRWRAREGNVAVPSLEGTHHTHPDPPLLSLLKHCSTVNDFQSQDDLC